MPREPDAITRLVRACEPNESLKPPDDRYVNCDDVRGENLVRSYALSLARAAPQRPEVKLFTGHRGVGKTCELFRLKSDLERDHAFKVVYFDVSASLDVNDLDFPDLLVFAAAEVQRQLAEANIRGFTATSTALKRVWDDIKGLLGAEVSIKEAEAETPFGSLTVELRNRPNARRKLRDAIERLSTNLLDAVNDLLLTANVALRNDDHEGLVLIIDGLDKLVYRSLDDGTSNTHDRLFLDRSDQLASLKSHTVYTVPISLFYSSRCAQLEQTFGEFNVPMPMIRLRDSDRAETSLETPGMQKMWEMIEARCAHANVAVADVFDEPATGRYLCEMTGGHPRHLMMFLQAAANTLDALPITRAAAERAVSNYANSLLREIPDAFWTKLAVFDEPQDDIAKDELHQQMLFLLHVFEYMNSRPWYEVNPVLRTLEKFTDAR